MRLRENEILAATAVGMYIVFFALNPPDWVRSVLANPVGMAALFGGSAYVALYSSKLVGGLLIVAFVLSMTRVTEHLTVGNVTIADGETYKCAESGEHGLVEGGKLRAFSSREIGKSYDSNAWTGNVKVISCAGSSNIRGATIRTPKAATGVGTGTGTGAPTWSPTTTYNSGDKVQYQGQSYTSLFESRNQNPATSPTFWGLNAIPGAEWSPATMYVPGDTVRSGGVTYTATASGSDQDPATNLGVYWRVSAGATGGNTTPPAARAAQPATGSGAGTGSGAAQPATGSGAGTGSGAAPPITTPTAAQSSTRPATPPAAPPASSSVPVRPVMSCNLENFAPF